MMPHRRNVAVGTSELQVIPFVARREHKSTRNVDYVDLVNRIQLGERQAEEEFCQGLYKGIQFLLRRKLRCKDVDDDAQEVLMQVLQAIRRRQLNEPERLMGFVYTVLVRQAARRVRENVHTRNLSAMPGIGIPPRDITDPEKLLSLTERKQLAVNVLSMLSERDSELLRRFYLLEQSEVQICSEMALTGTQFRLLKSRAKSRFGKLGRMRLMRITVRSI